jgi:gliding motility-associated-like protein
MVQIRRFIFCLAILAGLSAQGQCVLTVSPSNLSRCPGDSMSVMVSGGTSYTWSPSVGLSCSTCANPTVYVDSAMTYSVSSTTTGNQNAVNWNFSSGNTGFGTQYIYNATSIWNEGTYAVGPNPNAVHPNFSSWGDHTTGTGNYMIINGSTNGIKTIWSQTVALPAGSNATLSLWMLTLATPAGQFRVKINGTVMGSNQTTPASVGVWGNYTFPFVVNASGSVVVLIESVSTLLAGNDFGLDDIQFSYNCTASATLQVEPYPVPVAKGVPSDTLGCAGWCVEWADSSWVDAPATLVWRQWDWGDGSQDTGRFPTHCYTTEGVFQGTLRVVTNHGCISETMLPRVLILPPPVLEVLFDPTDDCSTQPGASNMVAMPPTLDPQGNARCFAWRLMGPGWGSAFPLNIVMQIDLYPLGIQPAGQMLSASGLTGLGQWASGTLPNAFSQIPDSVCFYYTMSGGCGDTLCVPLKIYPYVEMPNVFTPNGDGVNDYFLPKFDYGDWTDWQILSRWGQAVYSSQSLTQGWDGNVAGSLASDGVYFVVVRSGNRGVSQEVITHGTLHLMR